MNNSNLDDSPIGLTNVAGKYSPPTSDDSNTSPGASRNEKKHLQAAQVALLGEDLEKIRRSTHHSRHQGAAARRELMNDSEHDGIVKGLLYPALEDSFNESTRSFGVDLMEDYNTQAQTAVGGQSYHGGAPTALGGPSASSGTGPYHSTTSAATTSTSAAAAAASPFLHDVSGGSTGSQQLSDYVNALRRGGPYYPSSSYSGPSTDKQEGRR